MGCVSLPVYPTTYESLILAHNWQSLKRFKKERVVFRLSPSDTRWISESTPSDCMELEDIEEKVYDKIFANLEAVSGKVKKIDGLEFEFTRTEVGGSGGSRVVYGRFGVNCGEAIVQLERLTEVLVRLQEGIPRGVIKIDEGYYEYESVYRKHLAYFRYVAKKYGVGKPYPRAKYFVDLMGGEGWRVTKSLSFPDMVPGKDITVSSLREAQEMVRKYVKKLDGRNQRLVADIVERQIPVRLEGGSFFGLTKLSPLLQTEFQSVQRTDNNGSQVIAIIYNMTKDIELVTKFVKDIGHFKEKDVRFSIIFMESVNQQTLANLNIKENLYQQNRIEMYCGVASPEILMLGFMQSVILRVDGNNLMMEPVDLKDFSFQQGFKKQKYRDDSYSFQEIKEIKEIVKSPAVLELVSKLKELAPQTVFTIQYHQNLNTKTYFRLSINLTINQTCTHAKSLLQLFSGFDFRIKISTTSMPLSSPKFGCPGVLKSLENYSLPSISPQNRMKL